MKLKKPPKDQKESYITPPSGKLFKGTRHNEEIPRPFGGDTPRSHTAMEPFKPGKGAK